MRCIEIEITDNCSSEMAWINRNMRCIEINGYSKESPSFIAINRNMRCIEMEITQNQDANTQKD